MNPGRPSPGCRAVVVGSLGRLVGSVVSSLGSVDPTRVCCLHRNWADLGHSAWYGGCSTSVCPKLDTRPKVGSAKHPTVVDTRAGPRKGEYEILSLPSPHSPPRELPRDIIGLGQVARADYPGSPWGSVRESGYLSHAEPKFFQNTPSAAHFRPIIAESLGEYLVGATPTPLNRQ